MTSYEHSMIDKKNSLIRKCTVRRKAKYDELRYLPMLVGAICPLSIIMSLPPLLGPWKNSNILSEIRVDKPTVLTIVLSLAVFFLLLANTCLLLRFLEKRIVLNTWFSICFFLFHAGLMAAPLLHFVIYDPPVEGQKFTGDFLAGVAVILLSVLSAVLLMIDYFRHNRLRLRGSGVSNKQRNLVFFCIFVTLWSSIGAFIFSHFEQWTFTRGVYFTLATMTTIGFGDFYPKLIGTRIFLLFYATIGLVAMGIFINAIRVVILESLESAYFKNIEDLGMTELEKFFTFDKNSKPKETVNKQPQQLFKTKDVTLSRIEVFLLERETLLSRRLRFSIVALVIFWFAGAGIFLLVEKEWTYFDALYFCFVSFTTIGYGDVTPMTFGGIVVFIFYALVGLVTAAYVISIATEYWSHILEKRAAKIDFKHRQKASKNFPEDLEESHELAAALDVLANPTGDQKTDKYNRLLELSKLYHSQVGYHLAEYESTAVAGTSSDLSFHSLVRYQKIFEKLLVQLQRLDEDLTPSPINENVFINGSAYCPPQSSAISNPLLRSSEDFDIFELSEKQPLKRP